MSAGNGWAIVQHPLGGYSLVEYFESDVDKHPPKAKSTNKRWLSFADVVNAYYKGAYTEYRSEYGLTVDWKNLPPDPVGPEA